MDESVMSIYEAVALTCIFLIFLILATSKE